MVSESFVIDGIPFTILDTAGIRKTEDVVESIGVQKSVEAIHKADMVLAVFDATKKLEDEDLHIIEHIKNTNKKTLAVLNKTDTPSLICKSDIPFDNVINISCKTRDGLEKLEDSLSKLSLGEIEDSDIVSLNANQKESIKNAIDICEQLIKDIENNIDPSLIAVDLIGLTDYLDEIVGKITNEDMLDVMFKNFCIGK